MAREYITLIDVQTQGPRYDVTPLFGDPRAFAALVDDLRSLVEPLACDVVAGIDALGFVLGAALALRMGKGFLPIRKGGKLPVDVDRTEFVDYSGTRKTLELRAVALSSGQRVVVVDEWVETGAQVSAAIRLIEGRGAVVAGIATIHMNTNAATQSLTERYPCVQVWPEAE